MSAISTLPTPSSARFLTISLPSAPAPTTSTLAAASFFWSHQPIRRNRWKRSSSSARVSEEVTRRAGAPASGGPVRSNAVWLGVVDINDGPGPSRSGGDLRLEAQDVSVLHPHVAQGLRVEQLLARG